MNLDSILIVVMELQIPMIGNQSGRVLLLGVYFVHVRIADVWSCLCLMFVSIDWRSLTVSFTKRAE